MERFACKTEVVSGENALEVLGERGCRRLLMVTEEGQKDLTEQVIKAAGCRETEQWDCVQSIPTMSSAVEGSAVLREYRPDLVAALGGQNVLDCAKAMVCFSGIQCALAVIPMDFGTGTAMTDRVRLTHNGRRHLLQNRAMCPDLAILDGGLARKIPRETVADSGFELLASGLEAYVSKGAALKDFHAREAFALGCAALPAAFAGNAKARQRLQAASVLTGLAVNSAGLGLCRAMENSLGTVLGLSPGKAAGILLPAVIGCNAHAAGHRYAALAGAAGMGGSREEIGIRNLQAGLIRLRRELELPGTLLQAGVDIRTIWNSGRKIVELTLEDPQCRNNPVAVDDFLVRRILEEVTGRF